MLNPTIHKQRERPSAAKYRVVARLVVQIFLLWLLQLSSAWAGGSPETTLVVVNSASPLSLAIANAYVRMRDIPENHIVYLDNVPAADSIAIDDFRARIWKPIHDFITTQHLAEEIDTIAYSADFPYRVDFRSDLKAKHFPGNQHLGHFASLTGLTFFANRVASGSIDYLGENRYFRRDLAPEVVPPRPPTTAEKKRFDDSIKMTKHGDYVEAVESLQAVVKDYPWSADAWYRLARDYAALERKPEALAALDKAVEMGWHYSLSARDDKLLKPLRDSPRFAELIHQMQLKTGPFQPTHGFRLRYTWNCWPIAACMATAYLRR
jgi:tetratricopeptide (TPR) repeat protein